MTQSNNQIAPPATERAAVALDAVVRPVRAWEQRGYILVSSANDLPLIHDWYVAEWMAESAKRLVEAEMPEHLRKQLSIRPATIHFDWPNNDSTPPVRNA